MTKLLIDISHAPFGHENTYSGLFIASASLSRGYEVMIILRGDGVYTALKDQQDTIGNISLPATEGQIIDILDKGGKVFVLKEALELRGIVNGRLIEKIEVIDTEKSHDMMLEHDGHTLEF